MIKKLLSTLIFSLFIVAAHGQSQLEDVVTAIKSNHVSDMKKYFDNAVPITIDNKQSVYSRAQAEIVLKDFFINNNPKDLVIENSGAPDNTSKYAIGNFTTSNGKYNLYVLLKLKGNNYLLQEIRINKE